MALDFTLDKYRELCEAITSSQYDLLTVGTYLTAQNPAQECIVLRHDVDRKPSRALRMAELEREYEIKSTYYFRFNKSVFAPDLIREIAAMGHEIGYHYETIDKARGDYERAIQIFEHELKEVRKVAEVKTICMHGNPLTKWVNRDLWNQYDFRDFGIVGEAYLSVNGVTYLSDTGRTWGGKHKVKDWLPSTTNNDERNSGGIIASSTDDIIKLMRKGELRCAYLLVHPERWSNSLAGSITDLALDTGVNLAKRILSLRQGSQPISNRDNRRNWF